MSPQKSQKYNWLRIRRGVFRILENEVKEIRVGPLKGTAVATYDTHTGILRADTASCSLGRAVIHECCHVLLDHIWEDKATYKVLESWVTASEDRVWTMLTEKEMDRLRKLIEDRLVIDED